MISTDEELQQDVQRAGENAVRNGHGDPQQPTFKHIHGGLLFALKKSQTGYKVLLVPGVPLNSPVSGGLVSEIRGRVWVLRTAATHCCRTEKRGERKDVRL